MNKKLSQLINLLPILFFLLLALTPLVPIFSYDYHNHQRIWQIVLLATISFILIIKLNRKAIVFREFPKQYLALLITLLATGIASAICSTEIAFSLFYTFHIILLTLLLFYCSQFSSKKSILLFIYAFVIAHTALVLICFLNIVFSLYETKPLNPFVIYSGFINIRFFNQVQVFILPLLIFLLKYKKITRVVAFILIINLLLIFIGQARGAFLAFICTLIVGYFLTSTLNRQFKISFLCLVISGALFIGLSQLGGATHSEVRATTSGRIDIWLNTLSNLDYSHILLGNGPGIYEHSINNRAPFSHPHNSLVEVLNEWGLVATLCLITLVSATLKSAYTHLSKYKKDVITECLAYSFFIGVAYSLLSGVHVMPVSQTLLFTIWGFLIARINKRKNIYVTANLTTKTIIGSILLVAWLGYISIAIEVYSNIDPDKGYTHGPRFWSVGQRL